MDQPAHPGQIHCRCDWQRNGKTDIAILSHTRRKEPLMRFYARYLWWFVRLPFVLILAGLLGTIASIAVPSWLAPSGWLLGSGVVLGYLFLRLTLTLRLWLDDRRSELVALINDAQTARYHNPDAKTAAMVAIADAKFALYRTDDEDMGMTAEAKSLLDGIAKAKLALALLLPASEAPTVDA